MAKGKDARLEALGNEIDRLKASYTVAKERTNSCRMNKERAEADLSWAKSEIASVKSSISAERQAASCCYSAGDHNGAKTHSANARMMKPRLDQLYMSKERAYALFDSYRASFNNALAEQRRIKGQLDAAHAAFNARLSEVKAENARRASKWHERRCKSCGATIRYHEDWMRVPDLCKPCREREKAKWHEKPCKKCGSTIRYNIEWAHPPNLCTTCKSTHG